MARVISARELAYLCKLHAAKCALRRERDIQLSASRPKRETKMGMRLSTLGSSIQAWEKKVAERKAWCEEYGKAVEEGDVGRRNELDRVVPEKYRVSQRKHLGCFQGRGLPSEEAPGRTSSAGAAMACGWPVYSLGHIYVHHEPYYEATLPASPDSYVEVDDVSWYNGDSVDEEGEDEEEQYAEHEERKGERLVEGATTLESSMKIDESEALVSGASRRSA
ncbi:hypothetical protein I315_06787 [Cryptococcus gattii Ru294]|nr:hypothetical protein I315_06787 [Cryptococcus gattii Ru294]